MPLFIASKCNTVSKSFFFQELAAEISGLEKQRDELEAELKKVLSSELNKI